MTKAEIIAETVEYYGTHLRAVTPEGSCKYWVPETGAMCAVGRCFAGKPGTPGQWWWNSSPNVHGLAGGLVLDSVLVERYRGHSVFFWHDLQQLHDEDEHWRDNGTLTEEGQHHVAEMLDKWGAA